MKRLNSDQAQRHKSVIIKGLIILVLGLSYYLFITLTNIGIPCIFNLLTDLYCPGCGVSRMCISLFEFNFKAAFNHNCFILIISPFLAFFIIRHYTIYILTGNKKDDKYETIFAIIALFLAILFAVLRNISYFSFLAP